MLERGQGLWRSNLHAIRFDIYFAACSHYGTYRVSTSTGILGNSRLLFSLLVSFRIRMGLRIQLATLHAQAPAPMFVTHKDTVRSYFVNISDTRFNVNRVS
jgi:hypothetical protein